MPPGWNLLRTTCAMQAQTVFEHGFVLRGGGALRHERMPVYVYSGGASVTRSMRQSFNRPSSS
jgi:hypothetical protein